MNLDRALQLNTAALAVMGALFLGLGHDSVVLPLALCVAAVASVSLAVQFPWLRLNRIVANLIALAAVLWTLRHFLEVRSERQLLAIADMLVYLQIVLLFQEKTTRVYWQLVVLSLLQVVVAAALNLGPQFGLLLAAYMALALSALILLCYYRESKRLKASAAAPAPISKHAWDLLLQEPAVGARSDAAAAIGSARRGILARQVMLLALATIVFAGAFFYAIPRLQEGAWSDLRGGSHPSTGFAAEAALEESGRIHQSNQLVMRVMLSANSTREPYVLVSEPYFHGLALTEYVYDRGGGRWIGGRAPRVAQVLKGSPPRPPNVATKHLVREDIMLEGGSLQLFAILPLYRIPDTTLEITERPFTSRVLRAPQHEEDLQRREFRYAIGTSGLRNGRQLRAIPHRNPVLTADDREILRLEVEQLLRFDRQRFARLAAAADEILREAGVSKAEPLEQAQALERHFLHPGRFHYSLSLDFARDNNLDPVEDFVVNHRSGHCEYFASALVLMLRSRGIPARMVIGYKGGEFNSIGGYYQVRQKHAHAWVEALLPGASIPEWESAGRVSPSGNAWYRLDPTPSSLQLAAASGEEGIATRVMQTFDYIELLWRDYVLSLNAVVQEKSLYEPMSKQALSSLPGWLESRTMRRFWRWLSSVVGIDLEARSDGGRAVLRVADWRIGSAAAIAVLVVLGLSQGVYFLWRWLTRWRTGGAADSRAKSVGAPPFYRRLESLLARAALRRAAGQTARELASAAASRLQQSGAVEATTQLPGEIVAAYYRVRFGGAALDKNELAAIEQALVELTPAVNLARQ
jgi:transglutaminase-like putative cysteine protease